MRQSSTVQLKLLLLHVADCPHVRELTSRIDFARDGRRVDLVLRQVDDVDEAARLGMRGSPTLLIDGLDPFVTDDEPTMSCRLSLPTVAQLRDAFSREPV